MRFLFRTCGLFLATALLSGTAAAASVSYQLTGITHLASRMQTGTLPLGDVAISGTATLACRPDPWIGLA